MGRKRPPTGDGTDLDRSCVQGEWCARPSQARPILSEQTLTRQGGDAFGTDGAYPSGQLLIVMNFGPPNLKRRHEKVILLVCGLLWAGGVAAGMAALWHYAAAPGASGAAPDAWPAGSAMAAPTERATLVMAVHPRCPCTRASIEELARLMTQSQGLVSAFVLVWTPAGGDAEWAHTALADAAAEIPGVTILADEGGTEAARFGALTSGNTVIYDRRGRLRFAGGITGARGHAGDNAGRDAAVAHLKDASGPAASAAVFGCSLRDKVLGVFGMEK